MPSSRGMKRIGLIPLATLKPGDNTFELEGEPLAFGCEVREVKENPSFQAILGRIRARMVITRTGQRFLVSGKVFFRARMKCAICGQGYEENFAEELFAEYTSVERPSVNFVQELAQEELYRIPINRDFIDLTAMVRDVIHLAIPIAPKCRTDCSPDWQTPFPAK